MKLRSGFVSNSSSSSFCLLGVKVNLDKITKKDLKDYEEICVFTALEGNEGQILLHIADEDMLKFVQSREQDLEIYDSYGVVAWGEGPINAKNLPTNKKLVMRSTEEDYCSPRDMISLKEYLQWAKPRLLEDDILESDNN